MKDENSPTSFDPYTTSPTSPYSHSNSPNAPLPTRRRIPIVIVGNKRDRPQDREVSTDEAKYLASKLGCDFYETSAKTNTNVEVAFKSLVRSIKDVKRGRGVGPGAGGGGGGGGGGRKGKKKCVIL